jgi:hypothetical protein
MTMHKLTLIKVQAGVTAFEASGYYMIVEKLSIVLFLLANAIDASAPNPNGVPGEGSLQPPAAKKEQGRYNESSAPHPQQEKEYLSECIRLEAQLKKKQDRLRRLKLEEEQMKEGNARLTLENDKLEKEIAEQDREVDRIQKPNLVLLAIFTLLILVSYIVSPNGPTS